MTSFIMHFLICNLLISVIIAIFFIFKKCLLSQLTKRTQCYLWYLPLCLTIVPFIPIRFDQISGFFIPMFHLGYKSSSAIGQSGTEAGWMPSQAVSGWMNDFAISVNRTAPSVLALCLSVIWIIGIAVMIFFTFRSFSQLIRMKHSALPLQNDKIRDLYNKCLEETSITRKIPIYSTAFLTSPVITGLFCPRIYLPIHLISEYNAEQMHYMLLHELQHYRHKDNISNYLLLLIEIFYWFNPMIWLAAKTIRNEREIACDTDVLNILDPERYTDYGYTLIHFAQKTSHFLFPFSSSLGGSAKQLERRIRNIASYKKPSVSKRIKSAVLFLIAAILCAAIAPILTSHASDQTSYKWNTSHETIEYLDLSQQFQPYYGSFVLYDLSSDKWSIYNKTMASERIAPDSTYKIYDALFALEENIISPDHSQLIWNQTEYPFETWNRNQTLQTAMTNSVNWYFQTLDHELGRTTLQTYINQIGYGNKEIGSDLSSYWMESSLKISPIEQVKLLRRFQQNDFGFDSANIQAVKNSLFLSSSDSGRLYGKTGTGRVENKNTNGWFIGFLETPHTTYFFASNIQSRDHASGSNAAEITFSVLDSLNIWQQTS